MARLPAEMSPVEWRTDLDHVHPAVPDIRERAAELGNDWLAELRLTPTAVGWQQLTALIAGYRSRRQLIEQEAAALPDLLLMRAVASAIWRAGRWRLGLSERAEALDGLRAAEKLSAWLERNADRIVGLAAG